MRGNVVSIKGNLTRDAEQRSTASGKLVLEWSIAWNSSRRNQLTGEYENVPHYFDCVAWVTPNQIGIVAPQLVKGASCAIIEGSLEQSRWTANDGSNRSKVRIKVDDPISGMLVMPPRGNISYGGGGQGYQEPTPDVQQQQGQSCSQMPSQQAPASLYDYDIPF